MTPLGVIISNTCFRYHNLHVQKVKTYGEIEEEYKNRKKPSSFSPRLGTKTYTTGVLRGVSLRGGVCILALDEVQTVLYTHSVITRFLYQSVSLIE